MKKNLSALAAAALFCGGAFAEETPYFNLSAGVEYSTGNYGTTSTTDVYSLPVSALYESGAWALKITVPYLVVSGAGDVVVSGRSSGRHSTSQTMMSSTRSGLGDVVATASYNMYADADFTSAIDLTGRIKFGTASKGLGSGANDYAAQVDAYKSLGGFTPSLSLGYEVVGSSAELPTNNVYYGMLGASYAFGEKTRGGAEYRYAQQASATSYEQSELSLYASRQIAGEIYLRGYLLKGFASGSPDYGMGLSVSAGF